MKLLISCATVCVAVTSAHAVFFNSLSAANNATTLAAFRTEAGIASPEILVDFESIAVGTNVHGNASLMPNLTLTTTNSLARVVSGAGAIGGSNPIDARALEMTEGNVVTLTFTNPVDYIGGFDIDSTGSTFTAFLVGGGSETFSIETTGVSGNSAEFWGYVKNSGGPRITSIRFSGIGGSSGWGLDNLEYNAPVPEPATLLVLGSGVVAMLRRRRAAR